MVLTESMFIDAATKVVLDLVVKKFETINSTQKQQNISDVDLLSIEKRNIGEFPKKIRKAFTDMSLIVRSSIILLARDLENNRVYKKDIEESDLSIFTQNRMERLLDYAEAVENFAISHKTLSIVFKFIKNCNKELHIRAQTSSKLKDAKNHLRSVTMSGILIYEMVTIIIEHLEKFKLDGVDRILEIYQEAVQHIAQIEAKETALEEDYRRALSDNPEKLARQIATIENRRKARNQALENWEKIIDQIDVAKQNTTSVLSKLPSLRLLKRSAALHVETVDIVLLADVINREFEDIADLVDIDDLDLIPFTVTDTKSLLGFD